MLHPVHQELCIWDSLPSTWIKSSNLNTGKISLDGSRWAFLTKQSLFQRYRSWFIRKKYKRKMILRGKIHNSACYQNPWDKRLIRYHITSLLCPSVSGCHRLYTCLCAPYSSSEDLACQLAWFFFFFFHCTSWSVYKPDPLKAFWFLALFPLETTLRRR